MTAPATSTSAALLHHVVHVAPTFEFTLLACAAVLLLLPAPALSTPPPQSARTHLYQDSEGNLHIASNSSVYLSSAANKSVFVNDINMAERIRQLEAKNEALAASNAEILQQISTASAMFNRRLAALEAITHLNTTTAPPPAPPAQPTNNGTRAWTKILGSRTSDFALGVTVDSSDFVALTGYTLASASFPFDGAFGPGGGDIIASRLGPNGGTLWTKFVGTSSADIGYAVATDSTNNVYVAGYVAGSLDSSPFLGRNDFALVKLSSSGAPAWSRQVGTPDDDQALAVCVDKDDSVIAGGYAQGAVLGSTHAGGIDILIAKYSSAGDLLWLRQFGTALNELVNALTTDSAGNIYVTGTTYGRLVEDADAGADTANGVSTTSDLFVAKYDKDGTRLWIRQLGSDNNDIGKGIALDSVGNVYVACHSYGNLDGFLNVGGFDAHVIKFDTSGTKVWTRRLASTAEDYAQAVAVDSNMWLGIRTAISRATSTSAAAPSPQTFLLRSTTPMARCAGCSSTARPTLTLLGALP